MADRNDRKDQSNEKFCKYYLSTQPSLIPTSQHEDFINYCNEPLPVTFRVIAHTPHEEWIKKLVLEAQTTLNNLDYHNDETTTTTTSTAISKPELTTLNWYKFGTAYQFSANRKTLRAIPEIKKFSEFLTKQSENGSIIRQEAVSMVPAMFLMEEITDANAAILDLCSAPGSKTSQLLEQLTSKTIERNAVDGTMEKTSFPTGVVVANDLNSTRAHMMVHHLRYHNSPEFLVTLHNAAHFPNLWIDDNKRFLFDHVLCDVPCSGDGTVRKSPNAMKNWSAANGIALHPLQLSILKRGLALCKPGGRVVYSTCSMNPLEDESVVAEVLRNGNDTIELEVVSVEGLNHMPGVSSWKVTDKTGSMTFETYEEYKATNNIGKTKIFPSMFQPAEQTIKEQLPRCMRIYPHLNNTGGFFVAVLRKKASVPWEVPDQKKENWIPTFCDQTDLQCMSSPEASSFQDSFRSVCNTYGLTYDSQLTDLLWARFSERSNENGAEQDSTVVKVPRKVWMVTEGVRRILLAKTRRSKMKVMHAGLVFTECRKVNQVRMTSAGFRTALSLLKHRGIQPSFREDESVKIITPEVLELLVLGLDSSSVDESTQITNDIKNQTEDNNTVQNKAVEELYRVNITHLPEEDPRRKMLESLHKDRHYIFAVNLSGERIIVPCYVGKTNIELLVSLTVRHSLADLVRTSQSVPLN